MAIKKTTQICTDISNDHSDDLFMQNSQFIIPVHYNCILALLIGVHQPDVLGHEGNQRYLRGYVDWIRVDSKSYDLSSQSLVFGPLLVMVALYSRVVYTLWFKSNDGNQISNQQKVNILI